MSPHTFILICIIQSWNSVSCTFNIWLLIIKMSKEWVYIIVKIKMFAQKSTSLNYKKNNWHINAVEIASTMPLRYSIFFFPFIIPFIHLNFLPNSSSLNVKILYDGCDIEFDFLCWISSNNIFFKYNRNYKIESHLLSYDSTCEKQLIIIYSFGDFKKIWYGE